MMRLQHIVKYSLVSVIILLAGCRSEGQNDDQLRLEDDVRAQALSVLRMGLNDEEFWPSMHAAEGLTRAGFGAEVIAPLEERLATETDDQRRCGLARELVRAGDSSKVEILVEVLSKEDPYAHVHAAESLYKTGRIGDPAAMRAAFESDDNVALHLMAGAALARSGDRQALDAIRETYASGGPDAIRIGAWLLGRLGSKSDIDLLRSRLGDSPDSLTTAYIYNSLAALGDAEGLAVLGGNLESPDPAIRTYAAAFALDAGAVSLIPKLTVMLDDPHPDARYRAAETLLVLGKSNPSNPNT